MDNNIDLDHAVGLAFKLAHRMRAAQVAAGWDGWDRCIKPTENMQKAMQNRINLFVGFLTTPDDRGLSSYALRCDALETSLILMEGVIGRTRVGFQAQQNGNVSDGEISFVKKTGKYMSGQQVCTDAKIILEQMVDVQIQLMNSMENSNLGVKKKVVK